jgi:hypothetical protein
MDLLSRSRAAAVLECDRPGRAAEDLDRKATVEGLARGRVDAEPGHGARDRQVVDLFALEDLGVLGARERTRQRLVDKVRARAIGDPGAQRPPG